MANKRQSDTSDTTPAADVSSVSVPTITEGTDILPIIEPTADGTVEVAAAAMLPEAAQVANIETALAVLTSDNPARAALEAALETARGALALAEAEVALQAQKTAEVAAATAAAANLPAELLAAMLAAIDAKYAPAPEAAPEAEVAVPAPSGRKQPSARTQERNAAALAVMAADQTIVARTAAAYDAFRKDWSGDLRGVSAQAGTRYVSLVAFAGAGVANAADYRSFVPQLRSHLLSVGLQAGGDTYASDAWLFAFGPHAPDGPKGHDTLSLKFLSRAGVALCADGRFRLALPSAAGVRFVSRDAAALAAWNGGTAAAPASVTPAAEVAPAAPRVPTPPTAVALPHGGIAQTARCQHCTARNIVGTPACNACAATDWQVA